MVSKEQENYDTTYKLKKQYTLIFDAYCKQRVLFTRYKTFSKNLNVMENSYLIFSRRGHRVAICIGNSYATEFMGSKFEVILRILEYHKKDIIFWEDACAMIQELSDSRLPLKSKRADKEKTFLNEFGSILEEIAYALFETQTEDENMDYDEMDDESGSNTSNPEYLDLNPDEHTSKARIRRIAHKKLNYN